ncbi:hypothetical protein AB0D16_40500 [Streptomyces sp. NPDC048161]|uniref:hypothetical protein n=1 Tax=Streptomyces sp. NPDC048161 TaxID=3160985 RepID=UPI0033DC0CE4
MEKLIRFAFKATGHATQQPTIPATASGHLEAPTERDAHSMVLGYTLAKGMQPTTIKIERA